MRNYCTTRELGGVNLHAHNREEIIIVIIRWTAKFVDIVFFVIEQGLLNYYTPCRDGEWTKNFCSKNEN